MTKKRSMWPLLILIAVAIGLVGYRVASSRPAPMPASFDGSVTLDVAMARAESSGRPVLALATADWCGPCQTFKRGALSDPEVTRFITENTEAAYVDLSDANDPEASEAARMLSVMSIPALVLIDDKQEVSRIEGGVGASKLMDWLRDGVSRVD